MTNHDAHAWVPAAPFRAHLRYLQAASGLPWSVLALAAGVSPGLVRSLVYGRRGSHVRRISPVSAARLLGLDPRGLRALEQDSVPAATTAGRVRDLLADGCCPHQLAAWCRLTPGQLRGLERAARCSRLTALFVEAACLTRPRLLLTAVEPDTAAA